MTPRPSNAEIITIGRELLMGEIVDTNSSYLAQKLAEAGLTVRWASQVGDDIDHLREAFERALSRSDVTVAAGGLGPTSDDLTRESVAALMGEEMRIDSGLLEWLRNVFSRRGMTMPETNVKQATLIPSAEAIPNPIGTAPGWWVRRAGRHLLLLPGPPREIRRIWDEHVAHRLAAHAGAAVATRTLKTSGISEGGVDEMVESLLGGDNPYVGIYSKPDGIHLRVIARAESKNDASALIEPIEASIRKILGAAIWGVDDDTPSSALGTLLAGQGRTIAVFEGASGGAISSVLTRSPGHERWFCGSLVAGPAGQLLAMPALEAAMGGPQARLAGGLGEAAAAAMADGARRLLGADVGLGVTFASPADASHPEGTVFAATVSDLGRATVLGRFTQPREVAMQRAALLALTEATAALKRGEV